MLKTAAAQKLDVTRIKLTTDRVRCYMTNATIDMPEYSSGSFRLMQVQSAIEELRRLERQFGAEAALEEMMRKR